LLPDLATGFEGFELPFLVLAAAGFFVLAVVVAVSLILYEYVVSRQFWGFVKFATSPVSGQTSWMDKLLEAT
jgi:hypothetical protein